MHPSHGLGSAANLLQSIVVIETNAAPRQAPAMVSDTQCASPKTLPAAVVTAAMTHNGSATLVATVCNLLLLLLSESTVSGGSRMHSRVPAKYHTLSER